MQKRQNFRNLKALGGFAVAGAIGALGLFGVRADFRGTLGISQCVPRVDAERHSFQTYLEAVNGIAEEETQHQVQAIREALRSFDSNTARAVADYLRATGPQGRSMKVIELAHLEASYSERIRTLRADVAAATNWTGIDDFAFNTQGGGQPSADCPNGLGGGLFLEPHAVSRGELDANGQRIYYNPEQPLLGVKLFDEDRFFQCSPVLFGSPSYPNEIRRMRFTLSDGVAELIACTLRTDVMDTGHVVRTCSSVNLLDPWVNGTAPEGAGPQSLKILGDTAETALYHPEAIHQIDRDHPNGRVPYRMSESVWIFEHLSSDTAFMRSRCGELVQKPDYNLRGAEVATSGSEVEEDAATVVPTGESGVEPSAE